MILLTKSRRFSSFSAMVFWERVGGVGNLMFGTFAMATSQTVCELSVYH